jgi:hypothetical protein
MTFVSLVKRTLRLEKRTKQIIKKQKNTLSIIRIRVFRYEIRYEGSFSFEIIYVQVKRV